MTASRSPASRAFIALLLASSAVASVHAEGRFKVSADGQEVTDSSSQLTWRRCAEGLTYDGSKCSGKLARYDYRGAKRVAASAGAKGWHVPSREELLTLVDKNAKKKPKIDPVAFPNTPSTAFWAARAGSDDDLNAWLVNFANGRVMGNLGEKKFPLRLVRSGG